MNNKKILFVDDEATILKSFCISLKHMGYAASGASSGEEAMTMLQQDAFDVVVTDLKMPGIDGIQVLREAKKRYPEIVVIVLTGYGEINTAIDSLRLGADDYLHKPCDTSELVFRIENYLDKRETAKKLHIEQQRAARFEMITTLSGGLAHDFNNLLTGIMGAIELAKIAEERGESAATFLAMAMGSCNQAKELTNKFNQLSDMFISPPASISVKDLIACASEKLPPAEGTRIDQLLPESLWDLQVNRDKISMAVHAILVNASEALTAGGTIQIAAENFDTDGRKTTRLKTLPPGKFVKISIKDSGIGITPKNLSKVLDPYFSTKGKGSIKGMGLGLTLANAFIKQNGGHLHITSARGKGTTVTLVLPSCPAKQADNGCIPHDRAKTPA